MNDTKTESNQNELKFRGLSIKGSAKLILAALSFISIFIFLPEYGIYVTVGLFVFTVLIILIFMIFQDENYLNYRLKLKKGR